MASARIYAALLLILATSSLLSSTTPGQGSPVPLLLEQYTTLHVGQTAVLSVPGERRYDHYANSKSRIDGAWSNVLTAVAHSKRRVIFRATHIGNGVLLLSPAYGLPQDPNCVSCATLHYFVKVVPPNG